MKMWLFIVAVLLCAPFVLGVNLSSGETFNFTYVNVSNMSASEVFFCAAHNDSMCSVKNFTFSLNPGESYSAVNGSCTVAATCGSQVNTGATCIIDTTLNPGDTYRNNAGSCDIDIAVRGGIVTTTNSSVPQRQTVSIRKDGDVIHLNVGNRTFDIPVTSNSFSYDQVIELQCPAQPVFQETEDVDYLVKQCRSWVPMLDETISTLVVNTRTCSESAKSHVEDLKASSDREQALMTQVGTLQAQIEAANNERENAVKETSEALVRESAERSRADTNKALAWIFGVFGFVCLGILIFMALSTKVRNGGKQ